MPRRRTLLQAGVALTVTSAGVSWGQAPAGRKIILGQSVPLTGAASEIGLAFAAGAVIPLLPYLITAGPKAFVVSIALAAAALFGVGAILSFFTGRNALLSGLRMLSIGALAGAATYGIGKLIGVSVA